MPDLESSALYDYTAVTPDAIREGCEQAMRRSDDLLARIAAVPDAQRSFENSVLPLEAVSELLGEASGRYGFLSHVHADKAIRDVAHEYEQRLDSYSTALGFREDIYAALHAVADGPAAGTLDAEQARLLAFELRDFRRNGMQLPPAQRARLQELKQRLVALGIEFHRHIDEYQDAILVARDQLSGLPDSYIDGLRREETELGTRYRVSLDYTELFPFLDNADAAGLRRELFAKNQNKAAGGNVERLEEAIAFRDEVATTLGYESWAAYALEVKMAKTPAAALDFLADLERRVRPKAERDLELLRRSRATHLGAPGPVEIWDWRYYTQRVLREQHQVDQFEVARYFPLGAVLDGLFDLCQRLVGVRFVSLPQARAWNPEVRLFAVEDAAGGEPIGHFYMDLHPRPDKFGHAAAFTLRGGRRLPDGSYRRPVSAIVANFTKPAAASPSLLRHSEVVTLFHEFGHILHQVMTRARFARFAGTNVEHDFVEAPSQMLEHWCWEPAVLRGFTRHYQTGEPIPEALVQRMVAAKNVGSGIAALRQIFFGRLDLAYHGPGARKDSDRIARELHGITGFDFVEGTHFQAGFGHLFGYDAGYYGYMWSKVYGDDMFTRFQRGADDTFTRFERAAAGDSAVGRDYRRLILERGGSVDGDVLVRDFLGREPQRAAFLRDLGLEG